MSVFIFTKIPLHSPPRADTSQSSAAYLYDLSHQYVSRFTALHHRSKHWHTVIGGLVIAAVASAMIVSAQGANNAAPDTSEMNEASGQA